MKPDDISQDIWDMAVDSTDPHHSFVDVSERIARAIQRAVEREREACAEVAECHSDERSRRYSMDWNDGYIDGCRGAAAAIRARGK